jgi:hypothetical protein
MAILLPLRQQPATMQLRSPSAFSLTVAAIGVRTAGEPGAGTQVA